jgi:6-pyruvoyltetrahydropterin/6-carboxytetrahydropterin synthase
MAALYQLKIVTDFASAHTLKGYPGACARLHGHNWKVEVEVSARSLDSLGMGIDFKEIKKTTRAITDELDHHYLNDLEPFQTVNPTAENIAAYLYHEISRRLNSERVTVQAVTLWETERACVRYSEE